MVNHFQIQIIKMGNMKWKEIWFRIKVAFYQTIQMW